MEYDLKTSGDELKAIDEKIYDKIYDKKGLRDTIFLTSTGKQDVYTEIMK